MKRFLKKWYYRYITYKVTMAYLSSPKAELSSVSYTLTTIQFLVQNIISKISL